MNNIQSDLRVLIVAEHASATFGGEAVLPLHYYRMLRKRNIPVWMVVHERTKQELLTLCPEDHERIKFVPDTKLHRNLYRLGSVLPSRVSNFTIGFLMRILSQVIQRGIIKSLVKSVGINVIHQPMPVSPKEPSLLFAFGVPVIIGPMNGGMDYPPAFRQLQHGFETWFLKFGRSLSNALNILFPGKRNAAVLLVANERTKLALPRSVRSVRTEILVENGVDLSLWTERATKVSAGAENAPVRFVYMGRLVDWKAVDILIQAFAIASKKSRMTLTIIGDGDQRAALEQQAKSLGIFSGEENAGCVSFAGWMAQVQCAQFLQTADALVLTSLMECGGAVVLEAMAMGLPVIASNWGGPADYIDSSCGILVAPDERKSFEQGIADALCTLADDANLRQAMGRAGRERVKREFDWEVKMDRMLDIYRQEAHIL